MKGWAEEGTPTAGPKIKSETGPGPVFQASNVMLLFFPGSGPSTLKTSPGPALFFRVQSHLSALTTNPAIVDPTAPSLPWLARAPWW